MPVARQPFECAVPQLPFTPSPSCRITGMSDDRYASKKARGGAFTGTSTAMFGTSGGLPQTARPAGAGSGRASEGTPG